MVPHNSTILPCRSRFVKPMGGMFRKYSEYGRGPGKNGPSGAKNRPCEGRFGRGSGSAEAGKEAAEEGAGGDCGKGPDEQTEEEAARYDNRCAIAKEKARAKFDEAKARELARITEEGKTLNQRIAEKKARLQELEAQLSERMEAIAAKKAEYAKKLQDLEAEIAANPEVTVSTDIIPEDLPEWKEIEARIAEISATISDIPAADTTELTAKKRELTALLDEVKQKLSIRATIEKNAAKKAEILAREKELAQQQADLEKQEFTIDELNKARMDEVERRVNSKFQNVRFRMFEPLLNGGETPTCIAMVDGVKYADLNTAGKINAGLDIINTLCLYHGVSAPVFIDNAESVNQLFPVASQLVKLIVTTDKELTIIHL